MQIHSAILHCIDKLRNVGGPDAAVPFMRAESLPIDIRLERTAEDILRIYGKSTSGYGTFNQTKGCIDSLFLCGNTWMEGPNSLNSPNLLPS